MNLIEENDRYRVYYSSLPGIGRVVYSYPIGHHAWFEGGEQVDIVGSMSQDEFMRLTTCWDYSI